MDREEFRRLMEAAKSDPALIDGDCDVCPTCGNEGYVRGYGPNGLESCPDCDSRPGD